MEAINDVMSLLTQMELYRYETPIPYITFKASKNILIDEFKDEYFRELDKMLKVSMICV